ncbi:MAG TPA: prolyl oligopeptidase family serine peptidase [Phycisphaerae bacterium]|nr:prolyl oligopeptidase family serine peptidase [Phycisphaerae bacterium]
MRQFLSSAVVLCAAAAAFGQSAPPAAPMRPVVDDYFGVKVTDPYRYMENLSDPEVLAWFKAQGQYARKCLNALPQREQLLKDITKYVNSTPASVPDVERIFGGQFFLLKTLPDQNTAKLYMRANLGAPDTMLLDTDHYAGPMGEPAAINYFAPSNDGRYVAVGISVGGSEAAVIHILDTTTGKELPEKIDRADYGAVSWCDDNHSFSYVRLQKLAPKAPETDKYMNPAAFLHVLNTDPESDRKIMQAGLTDRIPMTPTDTPVLGMQPDSHFLLGVIGHGVQNEQTLYTAPVSSLQQANIPWVKVCDVDDQIDQYAVHGDDIYLLSHKGTPHFRILKTSLKNPDVMHASVVVPAGDGIIRSLSTASDALYIRESLDGAYHVLRLPYDSPTPVEVTLPFMGDAEFLGSDPRLPGLIFFLSGWTRGDRACMYDPATNQVTTTDIAPAGPYDNRQDITSTEVTVPSYDGTLVPMSIIYRKDLKRDGTNPVWIDAYGAYGMSIDPYFSRSALAWLDRGGVYAVAHVRGGGELGQDWYKGGYKLTKPNTWRDLIACGQYMIDEKYTSASRLAIDGGSAGGITMSRAVTERPDLFAAVCIEVGCCNALRMEQSANGPSNIPEFGSTQTLEGFEDLYTMDGTQHVRPNTPYPAVLLTTGMNDPRVDSWEPGKMAAHLQAATTSGKPVILRVDFEGGHGIGASKKQAIEERADMFAFFLDAFAKNTAATQAAGAQPLRP